MDAELDAYLTRRAAVLAKIRQMLITCLRLQGHPEDIDPDTALFGTGLGIDSLDAVEIVVALEMEFEVELLDPVLRRLSLRSVNGLVDLVLAAQENAGAQP